MDARPAPQGENGILKRLSAKTMATLTPHLKKVKLPQGTVLQEAGAPIEFIYFPTSGMVSMLAVLKSGEAIETGIIGREGVVGGYAGVYGWRAFGQAIMQIDGDAMRLGVREFEKSYESSEEVRDLINGYQSVVYFQAQQSAACQALHTVEARTARWLLHAQDAVGGEVIKLTQEFLSHMLGVRRTSVSVTATKLQEDGLITYKRGTINVRDRKGLEKVSCECYRTVRNAMNDTFPRK
jgi:CRP-like cAMP-binding protein